MDANNTRYHLLHGERDWLPVLVDQATNNVWWDRERISISLAPIVEALSELAQGELLKQENRRGAAYDHYGNIYWINDARTGIDYQPAATPLQRGQYWQVTNLQSDLVDTTQHGDFKTLSEDTTENVPLLSGLAITTHEYLVVGTLNPAGLLIFDLHAGGPPEWLRWPLQLSFTPIDMACSPGGGVWILSRNDITNEATVWFLDENFRLRDHNGEILQLNVPLDNDFTAGEDANCDMGSRQRYYSGILLNSSSPQLVNYPVAIEALSDEAFLLLETDKEAPHSTIYYFRQGELKDSVSLDEETIGLLLAEPLIKGHDFAFLPNDAAATHSINGLLYVSALTATQAFEFELRATESELRLVMQPKLLPMRAHTGRALIVSAHKAYYDYEQQNPDSAEQRWLPLTEQPRYLYQTLATIGGIYKDGEEPDCVWHRIILDACIPAGTSVIVETRAANSVRLLDEMEWQTEPQPYLRSEGSELPLHQPYAENESTANTGSWDLLLQNAVGRYIEVRLTLQGTRRATPRIRSMRIYYPRFSYLNRYLPDIYGQDQLSASFLDRFLGNVEGLYTALEDKIANAQLLFDTRTTPAEFLDWLGAWLGAFMDPVWDDERKRLFIDNAVLLFRWRGTSLGLLTMLRLSICDSPDSSIFEPLKQEIPFYEQAGNGQDIRIVEDFLTRGYPGISVAGSQSTSLMLNGKEIDWEPAMGPGVIHQNFQDYLSRKYASLEALNTAWQENYSALNKIQFPPLTPAQLVKQRDWREFTRDYIGFAYADVSADDTVLYQDFMARRYHQISRLNAAHGRAGSFMFNNFSEIPLPETLPANTKALSDWVEFVSLVLPIRNRAHKFTVLLPTKPGELPSSMELRKARVEELVKREKPAHTQFEVKYFWALFQIGNARLGIDTSLGEGSRFVALVLGANFLGQSYLAESHPWSVYDRSVVGRDRLRNY